MNTTKLNIYLNQKKDIASLAWFRILFGILMLFSSLRFILNGWVTEFYISPEYHFTYYGFDWIKPLPSFGMHVIFYLLVACSLLITLGLFYRFAIITFFIAFTYVELIDKTFYLNHYYFVSLISFLLCFMPANGNYSLDVKWKLVKSKAYVANVWLLLLKLQICCVYFFAGVAKVNYYWLIEAQPLHNWLKHQSDLPVIGHLLTLDYVAYIFSWAGCIFDLFIPFLLFKPKFRLLGFFAIVIFHTLTGLMFPIGVFPLVMIALTTVFFDASLHINILSKVFLWLHAEATYHPVKTNFLVISFAYLYLFIQLTLPFRHLYYPGELFWHEQGFRFSWRVMLIEKVGYTSFKIVPENGNGFKLIEPSEYLTESQIKQMNTQPDMILQFAHHLKEVYQNKVFIESNDTINVGIPKVYVNSEVSLFNKGSKSFIDPNIDLAAQPINLCNKTWILPYE